MTPKDKAKELNDKMFYSIVDTKDERTMRLYYDEAKQCALICVDEIVNTKSLENRSCGYITLNERHIEFWNEVKQEIKKL